MAKTIGLNAYIKMYAASWKRKNKKEQTMSDNKLIDAMVKGFEIVCNGNCARCGKPLSGDRIFFCEECEELVKKAEGADDE